MSIELLPLQREQADRIILSVGSSGVANFLTGLDALDDAYVRASYGLKIPRGANIAFGDDNGKKRYLSAVDLSLIAAERGVNNLIVDTRFGSEGSDLIADIDDWLDNFTPEAVFEKYNEAEKKRLNSRFYDDHNGNDPNFLRVKEIVNNEAAIKGVFPPSGLTVIVTGNTDQDELAIANRHATDRGVQLIAIIGSSKKSLQAYENDRIDCIHYSGLLGGIALGAGVEWMQTAATDAPELRYELARMHDTSGLVIVGSGAFTNGYPTSDHDRPVLIEHTSGVDKYIEGTSILKAPIPNESYADHIDAMPVAA